MRVLLSGATGFVGRALLGALRLQGYLINAVVREATVCPREVECCFRIADSNAHTDWRPALQGVDIVIHAAARVHVMREQSVEPLEAFRRVNVAGTLQLARQAAAVGIRRFIFISSIKVNGEETSEEGPFVPDVEPSPRDPYGISKMEAELALQALATETGMELVVIRPPLVYGPGVQANFLNMMRWLERGIPLPFGGIDNRRSLVALDNLVDLIVTCVEHPAAANRVFLVSDGEDLSTSELLRRLGRALGRPARLLPVPAAWLEAGAALVGRPDLARRLCGSLQVDIENTRTLLGWSPPVAVDTALEQTARHYLEHKKT